MLFPKYSTPYDQQEYDELYEHHENHNEYDSCNTLTFCDWYDCKMQKYQDNGMKLHLLRESYHKTLHYSIYSTSTGIILSESQLIILCSKLFSRFMITCRR